MRKTIIMLGMAFIGMSVQAKTSTLKDLKAIKSLKIKSKLNITSKRLKIDTDKAQAARKVRIAEILIENPQNMELAAGILAEALVLDPTNDKAKFYSAITKISLNFKGFYAHAKNHMKVEDAQKLKKEILSTKYPEAIDMAFNLPSHIKELKKKAAVSGFIKNNLMVSFKEAISLLGDIKADVTLIAPENIEAKYTFSGSSPGYYYQECYSTQNNDGSYDYHCYDYSYKGTSTESKKAKLYKLSLVDFKVLKGALSTMLNSMRIATAYNIEQADSLYATAELMDRAGTLSPKNAVALIKKHSGFLTLNTDHELSEIVVSVSDTLEDALDLADLRDVLCNDRLRSGYASLTSLCLDLDSEDAIREVLNSISGPSKVKIGTNSTGKSVSILTNVSAFLSNPIQDLKTLLPTRFTRNGAPVYKASGTYNGLFPQADLQNKLDELNR